VQTKKREEKKNKKKRKKKSNQTQALFKGQLLKGEKSKACPPAKSKQPVSRKKRAYNTRKEEEWQNASPERAGRMTIGSKKREFKRQEQTSWGRGTAKAPKSDWQRRGRAVAGGTSGPAKSDKKEWN